MSAEYRTSLIDSIGRAIGIESGRIIGDVLPSIISHYFVFRLKIELGAHVCP